MQSLPFEKGRPFSDGELEALERATGWSLPSDYRSFAKEYGGAFVGGAVDGNSSFPVLAFADFDQARRTSEDRSVLPDEFPLCFAHCELGNLWVFDRRGAVHYVNYYVRPAFSVRVADGLREFVGRIAIDSE